jgi:hypothetical protein
MARNIIFASLFALGVAGGAHAASDALLSGGGDDNTITYSGVQDNIAGGGTAAWVTGGEYATFSHTGPWPGQGDRSAALRNGSGGGGELFYFGSVAPAPALASIGAPAR